MSRAWLAPVAACALLAAWALGKPRRLDHPHPHKPTPRLSEEFRRKGWLPVDEPEDIDWQRGEIAA